MHFHSTFLLTGRLITEAGESDSECFVVSLQIFVHHHRLTSNLYRRCTSRFWLCTLPLGKGVIANVHIWAEIVRKEDASLHRKNSIHCRLFEIFGFLPTMCTNCCGPTNIKVLLSCCPIERRDGHITGSAPANGNLI